MRSQIRAGWTTGKTLEILPLWEEWRQHHNALVNEYDKVKRDVRFEKLFFPRREGRWGAIIPDQLSGHLAAPSGTRSP